MDLAAMTLEQGLATLFQADSPLIAFFKSANATTEKRAFNLGRQEALGALLGGGLGTAYGYLQGADDESQDTRLNRATLYGLGGATAGGAGGSLLRQLADAPANELQSWFFTPSKKQFQDMAIRGITSRYGVAPKDMNKEQAAEYLASIGGRGSLLDQALQGYVYPLAGGIGTALGGYAGGLYGSGIKQLDPSKINTIIANNMQAGLVAGQEFTTGSGRGQVTTTVPPKPSRPYDTWRPPGFIGPMLPGGTPNWSEQAARSLGYTLDPAARAWLSEHQHLDPRPGRYFPLERGGGFRSPNPAGNRLGRGLGLLGGALAVQQALRGAGWLGAGDTGKFDPLSIIRGLGSRSYNQSAGEAPTREIARKIIEGKP